ncbi:MAG: Ig-like domain-containing protein [Gemmatimonadota bacterium]|nr:MAG: Ig-like domain-containing protein [Gemmatimonadota bacterium]
MLLGDDELSNGQTTSATATVRRDGAPEQGITVNFSSSNTGVAAVAPASVQTDASGQAVATVTGVRRGDATITATADGVSASAPVDVPDLSLIGMLLLVLILVSAGILRRRTVRVRG